MDIVEPASNENVSLARIADTSVLVGTDFGLSGIPYDRKATALRGEFAMIGLRPGIVVHTSDATDLCDMTTSVEQQPGLTIHLFLEGTVDASLGGRPLSLGRRPGEAVKGVITARAHPDLFERHSHSGRHVRKVNVTVSNSWLSESAFETSDEFKIVRDFASRHLARFEWLPDHGVLSLAEQLLHPPRCSPLVQNLYLESRALELVSEAFAALTQRSGPENRGQIRPFDRKRLRMIEDYLEAHGHEGPSLQSIARSGGVSVSTLRRLFRAVHGMTVFEYVRHRGLDRARRALEREGVSVTEAAFIAGYGSPANFATAFKRHFGVTPTETRRH